MTPVHGRIASIAVSSLFAVSLVFAANAQEIDDSLDFLIEAEEPAAPPAPVEIAAADEADEPVQDVAAEEEAAPRGPSLDEIVVTAQKRAEDIQDVPLSVSAIGGDALKEKNLANLEDVAGEVPNLHIEASPTFNYIYMRGIGSGYNRGFEQSVAIIIDDVFYGRPSYLSNGMLDLYAIEVLRGPQGTLFGKNSVAGVMHLRTANPEAEWAANGDFLAGSEDEHYRFRAAIQGPIFSDELSFRIAFSRELRDGNITNTTRPGEVENDLDTMNARIKVRWEPSATFNTVLSVNGANVNQDGPGSQLLKLLPRHLAAMQVFDPLVSDDFSNETSHTNSEGMVDRDTWDVTSTTNWDFAGDFTLTNVLNYAIMDEDVQFDADFSPIPLIILNNNENYEQISEELRLTSPPGDLEYVVGAYYFRANVLATFDVRDFMTVTEIGAVTGAADEQYDNAALGTLAGQQICLRQFPDRAAECLGGGLSPGFGDPDVLETSFTTFDQISTSYAIFGQGTWHITDSLGLTIGVRGTMEEKELDYVHILLNHVTGQTGQATDPQGLGYNPLGTTAFPVIQGGNQQFSEKRTRKEYDVSPKASITYQWNDDVMTYFTYARGFKSGGFNAQALNPGEMEYESEESDVYEVGIKSEFLGGAARFNASVFYSDYQDLQTTAFNGTTFVVVNAATAEILGIEFEGAIVPVEWLMIAFSGSYTDATFNSFDAGPCPAQTGGGFPGFFTNTLGVTDAPVCDLAGEQLVNAPKWVGNVDIAYDNPLFDWPIRLMAAVGANYSSDQFNALDHDPFDVRPGKVIFRARAGIRDMDDQWYFTIFATNLTDVSENYTSADIATFAGSHFGTPTPKRRISAEFGMRF